MLPFFGDLPDDRSRVTGIGDGEMLSFQKAHDGRSSAEVIIDGVLLRPCPAGATFHESLRPIRIFVHFHVGAGFYLPQNVWSQRAPFCPQDSAPFCNSHLQTHCWWS